MTILAGNYFVSIRKCLVAAISIHLLLGQWFRCRIRLDWGVIHMCLLELQRHPISKFYTVLSFFPDLALHMKENQSKIQQRRIKKKKNN